MEQGGSAEVAWSFELFRDTLRRETGDNPLEARIAGQSLRWLAASNTQWSQWTRELQSQISRL